MIAYAEIQQADTPTNRHGRLQTLYNRMAATIPLELEKDRMANRISINPEAVTMDVRIVGTMRN